MEGERATQGEGARTGERGRERREGRKESGRRETELQRHRERQREAEREKERAHIVCGDPCLLRDLLRQRLDEVVALHFAVVLSTVWSRDDDMHGRLVSPSPSLPRSFSLSLWLYRSLCLSLSLAVSARACVSLFLCVRVCVRVRCGYARVDMCSPRLRPLALRRSWELFNAARGSLPLSGAQRQVRHDREETCPPEDQIARWVRIPPHFLDL